MTSEGSVFSFKFLVLLTGAVLLAHLAALRTPLAPLTMNQLQTARAFITRSLVFKPVTAPPAPKAAATRPASRLLEQPKRPPSLEPQAPNPAPAPSLEPPLAMQSAPPEIGAEAVSLQPPADTFQAPPMPGAQAQVPPPRPLREYAVLANAEKLPGSIQLNYQVNANKFPYSLNSELLWQQDGSSYSARLAFKAFGQSRVQTSRGQIGSRGLEPARFSDKYRSEVAAHFVRDQGKVTFSANTPDVPLLAGAQDRLSILIQLAGLIGSAPGNYPVATTIAIQTIGPRDADTWLFTVGETETLKLPGGSQETLKLVRNPRQEFDQKVELWLAPGLGYLPARVRITEPNGDFIDQQWLSTVAAADIIGRNLNALFFVTLEIPHSTANCVAGTFKG
jgi:hypothetical protein